MSAAASALAPVRSVALRRHRTVTPTAHHYPCRTTPKGRRTQFFRGKTKVYQTNWLTLNIGGRSYQLSRYRLYMAELGIFLSRDFLNYPNKYRAWSNSPLMNIDHNGLISESDKRRELCLEWVARLQTARKQLLEAERSGLFAEHPITASIYFSDVHGAERWVLEYCDDEMISELGLERPPKTVPPTAADPGSTDSDSLDPDNLIKMLKVKIAELLKSGLDPCALLRVTTEIPLGPISLKITVGDQTNGCCKWTGKFSGEGNLVRILSIFKKAKWLPQSVKASITKLQESLNKLSNRIRKLVGGKQFENAFTGDVYIKVSGDAAPARAGEDGGSGCISVCTFEFGFSVNATAKDYASVSGSISATYDLCAGTIKTEGSVSFDPERIKKFITKEYPLFKVDLPFLTELLDKLSYDFGSGPTSVPDLKIFKPCSERR